ncbi:MULTISPECIES: FCD domain-containing protein [unclassified Roseitalea]|uniref:FCD domain-containing protein n=1 Tax=unclassified Roseitalea TaxID=2639107 RepID=UPI00273EDE9B|nr:MULTISPECIES: FCD domain-containing protein [unclassified Roseitalea]
MARKKYQEIAEHLELLILSGRVKPGDRLPAERQLMEQFNAGRSSVREALFALQRQGLLTSRPGAVPRVSLPSAEVIFEELSGVVRHYLSRPEGLRDLQDARALFEIGLARRAASIATDADISALSAALEANRSAGDLDTFAETDVAFHLAIARISGNTVFESLNKALAGWLRDQRMRSAAAGATFSDVVVQHQAIFDAIVARDPEAAAEAMEDHLEEVARLYWQAVLS